MLVKKSKKFMMTSSIGNIFRVTGHLLPVTGEFPAQRPVTRSFDVFFDLRPNKRLCKQAWGWRFETSSSSLWRHCNDWRQVTYTLSFHRRELPMDRWKFTPVWEMASDWAEAWWGWHWRLCRHVNRDVRRALLERCWMWHLSTVHVQGWTRYNLPNLVQY